MEMKNLPKVWKRYPGEKTLTLPKWDRPTVDNSLPMDTREQEEFVSLLEKEQAQQSYLWRRVFAVILLCYGAFLVWSIFQQATLPWELKFYAYFMEEMESWMVIAAGWAAVVTCTMAMLSVLRCSDRQREVVFSSFFTGALVAACWMVYMLRMPMFKWNVVWLPFGPLSAAVISFYVDRLLKESSDELRKLRSYMYAYKSS